MTRKDDKGDQPSGGETTWTNTGATRYGRGQHKTGSFGDDMLRPSPNHGTQRLPNDDDDEMMIMLPNYIISIGGTCFKTGHVTPMSNSICTYQILYVLLLS